MIREQELVRIGCIAADVHLTCSYPECSCSQMPAAIKAVLSAIPQPIRELEERRQEVIEAAKRERHLKFRAAIHRQNNREREALHMVLLIFEAERMLDEALSLLTAAEREAIGSYSESGARNTSCEPGKESE